MKRERSFDCTIAQARGATLGETIHATRQQKDCESRNPRRERAVSNVISYSLMITEMVMRRHATQ
jgi:hypothetical protein